jgi:N6-adenosine-specific RNA methylase IME4
MHLQGLPYGTMSDDEMRSMGIAQLQDDGVIFMWVTGVSHDGHVWMPV